MYRTVKHIMQYLCVVQSYDSYQPTTICGRLLLLFADVSAKAVTTEFKLQFNNFFTAFLWTIETERAIVNQLYAGSSSRSKAWRLNLWVSFSTLKTLYARWCNFYLLLL